MLSVASSKQSNSKVTGSEHNSESAADDSSMKKPPTVSALHHYFGHQTQHLSVKQRLANFHAKLKKGNFFESQVNPVD